MRPGPSPAGVAWWAWRETGAVWWLDDARPRGGWSYVCWDPAEVITGPACWDALAAAAEARSPAGPGPPFRAGLAGWLGYDAGRERPGVTAVRGHADWPAAELARFDAVLAHHPRHGWVWTGTGDSPLPLDPPEPAERGAAGVLGPEADPDWHEWAVHEILSAIAEGDVYEANLTLRLRGEADDPFGLYLGLRRESASGRCAFVGSAGAALGCGSPERLLGARGARVVSEPMKGTARAGEGTGLLSDPKEMAELAIAVDLVRDDLHRVCRRRVRALAPRVESLPTVDQASARVRGVLLEGKRPWNALAALLPSGSVTGAPRSAVMPLLDRLEPSPRGPYTGAVGWFGAGGDAEVALPIRTFLWKEGDLEYGVGGGITRRSKPAREWTECRAKSAAIGSCLSGGVEW